MKSKRLNRVMVIVVALGACAAFLALAITSLDFSTDMVVSQLLAVAILVAIVIGAAALTAYLIRLFASKRNNNRDE